MLLWTGKQLYGQLPESSAAYRSMEKFAVHDARPHGRLRLNPITWGLRVMQLIDRRNNSLRDPYRPSVNLALRVVPGRRHSDGRRKSTPLGLRHCEPDAAHSLSAQAPAAGSAVAALMAAGAASSVTTASSAFRDNGATSARELTKRSKPRLVQDRDGLARRCQQGHADIVGKLLRHPPSEPRDRRRPRSP